MAEGRGTRALHVPTAVVAALCTAALVNVAQYPAVEDDVSPWYGAVRPKPAHDLLGLAEAHFSSTQGRYVLYLQLGELAPGAVLEKPAGLALVDEHLHAFADVAEVEVVERAVVLEPADVAVLEPFVVATGEDRHAGDWLIALAPDGPVERVVVARDGERTWFVDAALLDRGGGP